jgi:glycosyltransferase involved in cell wall biosynthesis
VLIGLDAYAWAMGFDGFAEYTRRLARGLRARGHDIRLYAPRGIPLSDPEPGIAVMEADLGLPRSAPRRERDPAWYDRVLPDALAAAPVEVFVGTGFFLPSSAPCPLAVTVHDVIFLTDPQYFSDDNLALYTQRGRDAVERADGILAVSESTAAAMARFWPVTAPLAVTPLASVLDDPPDHRAAGERILAELGIEPGFVLSFAATHRRKNLDGALAAYAALPGELRARHPLVLAGADTDWTRRVLAECGSDAVALPQHLPGDLMASLYAAAAALLHPTYAEGFGLPVLDAMVCGTPVIASDRPSVPEVAGDAALLRDPDDADGLAADLEAVLTDRPLARRLGAAGRARASRFSWADTAARTETLLRRIVAE